MKLYIIRHGSAAPHGTPGMADDDRPLTEAGRSKMKQAAAGYRALGICPGLILSSPLPRALQTAEILQQELETRTPLRICDELSPSGARDRLYQEIARHTGLESLMIVGHQPSLGEIAGEIAWGSAERFLDLKKGGGCGLELTRIDPRPRGTLLWLLPPSLLRKAGS